MKQTKTRAELLALAARVEQAEGPAAFKGAVSPQTSLLSRAGRAALTAAAAAAVDQRKHTAAALRAMAEEIKP